ncbi:hypothetical protein T484DRAFT_1775439 [Baffinella frigidus]|nr:hypothetical protein T484DRAFT_1775439 [Cryptophyta sp. CCMP2293]
MVTLFCWMLAAGTYSAAASYISAVSLSAVFFPLAGEESRDNALLRCDTRRVCICNRSNPAVCSDGIPLAVPLSINCSHDPAGNLPAIPASSCDAPQVQATLDAAPDVWGDLAEYEGGAVTCRAVRDAAECILAAPLVGGWAAGEDPSLHQPMGATQLQRASGNVSGYAHQDLEGSCYKRGGAVAYNAGARDDARVCSPADGVPGTASLQAIGGWGICVSFCMLVLSGIAVANMMMEGVDEVNWGVDSMVAFGVFPGFLVASKIAVDLAVECVGPEGCSSSEKR